MKTIKVSFDFDGNTVTASGNVWDSLFVDKMHINVEDSNYDKVALSRSEFHVIKEMAEEIILDKYSNTEVEF
ncbi:MAG: hypothetical protein ACK5XN_04860 [Bacteroidota bacterium]|jgi:hypothetical protein